VTGSDPEVTSFDRKSPGSGCRRPKTCVYCTFHFLQGCSSQWDAVTWQEMTSRDNRWPEVTRRDVIDRKSPGSGCRRLKTPYILHFTSCKAVACSRRHSRDRKWLHVTLGDRKWPRSDVIWPEVTWKWLWKAENCVYCTFHFLQGCSSRWEAVTWQEMTSRDLRWPEVTWKWRQLTGSHLEVAIEGRKLPYTVHFTSYKALARSRRQSRDSKRRHVTGNDPEVSSLVRKAPRSGFRSPKTRIYCTFHFLQGCSSRWEAVTWQEITWRDLRWPEVTRKWRHLIGSHLEVAVEGRKLVYTVHFTSYKALARSGRQSLDRTWRHVTSGDRNWPGSHVNWLDVTWKL